MHKKTTFLLLLSAIIFIAACTSEVQPTTDECTSTLTITFSDQEDSNCGLSDGGFTVNVTGGEGDYSFQLGNAAPQSSPIFSSLAAGSYTVTVTSDDGCTANAEIQILNQDGVNATLVTTDSDCENPSGTISVTATDGEGPYQFRLNDGSFQAGANFSDLSPGEYEVTVRDANGCEVELQAEIESDVTFDQIQSIVTLNCAVSGCHDGSISPDFRSNATIIGSANRIRARTSNRTMPPSGRDPLSDEEIADIICWVNDGAQGN